MLKLLFIEIILVFSAICEARDKHINDRDSKEEISSALEMLGFSPACISGALTKCESKTNFIDLEDISEKILRLIKVNEDALNGRPRNCHELQSNGDLRSDVCTVYPYDSDRKVTVHCDQTTDGGGWTVFQNRVDMESREDFYRTWLEYKLGFGNKSGEFWLGLDNIHALVSSTLMEMRIDLEDYKGRKWWAKYGIFHIGDSSSQFTLTIDKYTGNAGDGMGMKSGMKFSTHDQDNDISENNCAVKYRGAWWYKNCHDSNLNGYHHKGNHATQGTGINWHPIHGSKYSFKRASMKLRPLN